MRLSSVELKASFAEILNRVQYTHERVVIHRRGKNAAVMISVEDYRLLLAAKEDQEDAVAAIAALAESDELIPYTESKD